jgi:hypothetical protein
MRSVGPAATPRGGPRRAGRAASRADASACRPGQPISTSGHEPRGRGAGGKGAAYGGRAPPTTEGVWPRNCPSKVRDPATEGKDVLLARVCLEAADCGSPMARPAPGSRLSLNCSSPRCKPGRGSPNRFCPNVACDQAAVGPGQRAWMGDPRVESYLRSQPLLAISRTTYGTTYAFPVLGGHSHDPVEQSAASRPQDLKLAWSMGCCGTYIGDTRKRDPVQEIVSGDATLFPDALEVSRRIR